MELRAAVPGDAGAIADLWHEGWRDGHLGHVPAALVPHRTLDHFRRRVEPRLPATTVATDGDRLLGFVTLHEDEVEQLFVARESRGSGVADALLRYAEQRIAERFATAWLAVVEGNGRARRFYERCGWRDAGGFDYLAEIEGGRLPVRSRRYEKRLQKERS